jgi:uncharacterized protein
MTRWISSLTKHRFLTDQQAAQHMRNVKWQALLVVWVALISTPLHLNARVVTTDTPGSAAAREGRHFTPDSITGVAGALDTTGSVGKLVATAPKRVSPQILLGLQRLYGLQGPLDLKQAGDNFMLAYARGDAQAPAAVALCTLMGCYGTPDRRSVALWIERARVREPAKAKLLEWASAEKWSESVPRNRAAALLREAIALQDPVALNEQGLQQLTAGQRAAALKSFELAAKRGSPAGARNFNLLVQQPEENATSRALANAPSTAEARSSQPGQSLYEQAKKYHAGQGVPVNDVQAIELYRQAASQGHLQAKRMLELIFVRLDAKGTPDPVWMRLLAQQHIGITSYETKPTVFWPQKDISLVADWLPQE